MKFFDFIKGILFSTESDFKTIAEEKSSELALYRFAVFNAIQMIASAMCRYEFEFQKNGKRIENEDWFALNFEPNKNQSKQEFFYDFVERLSIDGKALCVDIGTEHFIADSFSDDKDSCGFGTAHFSNIEKNSVQLDREYDASEVLYFQISNTKLRQLLTRTSLEYLNLLDAAGKKFKNSAYQKGILKINTQASGNKEKEQEQDAKFNEAIKRFYNEGNAVLPLKKNYDYEELGKYRNTGTTDDIGNMTFQVYSRVAEAFGMNPYWLMGSAKEPELMKAQFYKECVERYVDVFVRETNRKHIGKNHYIGKNSERIRLKSVRPWDIDELVKDGSAVFNLVGSGTVSIDEVRERQGREPLNTEWSKAHYISLNLQRIDKLQSTAKEE